MERLSNWDILSKAQQNSWIKKAQAAKQEWTTLEGDDFMTKDLRDMSKELDLDVAQVLFDSNN